MERTKKRAYVGLKDSRREKIYSHQTPNKMTHPQFDSVVGPFRTVRGANHFVNNPQISTTAEAEKEAVNLLEQLK